MIARESHLFEAYTRAAMADRAPKRKTNAKRGPDGVLGTLPASRPERIGRPRGKAAPKRAAVKPKPVAAHGPEAVTPGCPPLRHARVTQLPRPKPLGPPTGTELVTTTIRAAGELAQIGFVVGGQVLKRTIDRIPRP
jgi:hypothetical protein